MYSTEIELAIKTIAQQYEIIGEPVDLQRFFTPTGKTDLYNTLTQLHRPAFENNQRIVIVQSGPDEYLIDGQAGSALTFLQECLQKIDISNFFVIVVSGNPEIASELNWLQKNHSSDTVAIGYRGVNIPYTKQYTTQETFCMAPWVHLYLNTTGEVLPCCTAEPSLPVGDLKVQTVDAIVNGERMQQLRQNMINNRPCQECVGCYEAEKNNISSNRNRFNQRWGHLKDELVGNDTFVPKYLDLRFNNICNLKCRTCSGHFSSQLAQEEKKLFNNAENFNRTLTTDQRAQIFDNNVTMVDQAEMIYFAGGEPLLMREHYATLDRLLEVGNTDLEIVYNTNFTTLAYKDKNVLDYWKKFANIKIGASLDGHGAVFEYIRHGAKWADIEQNLSRIKEQCPHINFTVSSTVSLVSAESIMELQRMWHEQGKLDISKFVINPMIGSYLSLQMLLPHHKTELSKKIKAHCTWLDSVGATGLSKDWNTLETFMFASDASYTIKEFAPMNRARDIERKENFESVFPQYRDLFNV